MRIKPFQLEKWLSNSSEIDVGGGVVGQFKLKDIANDFDYEQSLSYSMDTKGSEALRE